MWVLTTALVPNLLNQIIIGLPLYIAPFVACIHGILSPGLHDTAPMQETLLTSQHDCNQGHINAMMCNSHLHSVQPVQAGEPVEVLIMQVTPATSHHKQ